MGTTNHGLQNITFQYYLEATGDNFGRRNLDILPVGIYKGGYFTKVSNTEVSLSTFVAEIQDGTNQISVRSTSTASLSSLTLDSGAISSATPYLVFCWLFLTTSTNYVEIHALSSLSVRQENDVVIGKCVFSGSTLTGFDYSQRSFPQMQSQNLRVEATADTELYVRVRGGRVHTGNASLSIGDQKVGPFAVPGAGLSRIDLVYVDFSGGLQIHQGAAAASPSAPNYIGKLVLAEVRLVNGDTNITWDRITDVRAVLNHANVPDETTIGYNSNGKLYAIAEAIHPYWNVSIMDANNLTLPSQFTTPIATFKDLSYGTISKTVFGAPEPWLLNNSALFRMGVTATANITKVLKLFAVDNKVYVYIDSSLVFSRTSMYLNGGVPLDVNLILTTGNHTIDVVFSDQGGEAYLSLVGDVVDDTVVLFRAL